MTLYLQNKLSPQLNEHRAQKLKQLRSRLMCIQPLCRKVRSDGVRAQQESATTRSTLQMLMGDAITAGTSTTLAYANAIAIAMR